MFLREVELLLDPFIEDRLPRTRLASCVYGLEFVLEVALGEFLVGAMLW